MIDTIGLALPARATGNIITRLKDAEEHNKVKQELVWYTGFHRNMRFSIKNDDILIYGSLCKFAKGTNIPTLTCREVGLALEKLADEVHLPIHTAQVLRLDAGSNFRMKRPIPDYLLVLGKTKRYKRRQHHNQTVAYDLKCRTLHFYDKNAELRRHKIELPLGLKSKHLLRYEIQWKKQVKRQWGRQVRAGMLATPSFFAEIVNRWQNEYNGISKVYPMRIAPSFEWSEFVKQAVNHYVDNQGGIEVFSTILESARRNGDISSVKLHRFKRRIVEYASCEQVVLPSVAVEELDSRVEERAKELLPGN